MTHTDSIAFCRSQIPRVLLFSALLGLMLLAIAGCSRPEPEKLPVLRIGHAPNDHHAPLYIAAMNPDFFTENGGVYLKEITFRKEYVLIAGDHPVAEVFINSSSGGKELIRTLDEKHNDITFGGVPAMLSFIDQGSDMQILLPVMSEGSGLVVRNDLPVTDWQEFIKYVNDQTEPVKIGYKTAVSVQNLIFETALQTMNIPFARNGEGKDDGAKVILVNLFDPRNLIPALQNGIIDGFVVNQPFVAEAEQQKAGKVIAQLGDLPPTGKWKNNPCCALAGNTRYVARYPQVVEPLLSLLLRANQFITRNPERSAAQIAQWLGIDPEIERLSLPTIRFTTEYDADWDRGVHFWVESMIAADMLNKDVKEAHEKGILDQKIYNMQPFTRARKNL